MNQTLDLINVTEFKALSTDEKKIYLGEIRKVFPDKDIRDFWEMKYATFHYYLTALKLNKEEKDEPKTKKEEPKPQKNNSKPNNTNGRNIIEAEYSVVEDKERENEITIVATKINPAYLETTDKADHSIDAKTPMMNFPNANGNVAQLRKKLEGILMILETEGEEANFQMKIQVFQK